MTAAPVSLLMIGCGGFARRYHVPALLADSAVRIAGSFDPHPQLVVHALAERYGAPVTDTIDALPQLTANDGLAFALVTTPHMLHAAHVDAALDRNLHVLVDKPFVMTADDAIRLAHRADAAGRINGVAYNRRFDAGCRRARELIRDGEIGTVRFVQTVQLGYERAGWFLVPELGGGGPYTGRATHMADIVPWLLGRTPTRLRSRLRTSATDRSDHGGFIELQFADLECQMTCIEEGWHMWDEIRIFGDDGLVELRRPLTAPIGWSMTWLSERGTRREHWDADSQPGDATRDFLDALRIGRKPACTFAEAVPSVTIIELAFRSAGEGGGWLDLPEADHNPPGDHS
jgi:predicted dehydrogenase